ncbi:hypothetical protein EV715DRAFT_262410 [Schizophyllum commune]
MASSTTLSLLSCLLTVHLFRSIPRLRSCLLSCNAHHQSTPNALMASYTSQAFSVSPASFSTRIRVGIYDRSTLSERERVMLRRSTTSSHFTYGPMSQPLKTVTTPAAFLAHLFRSPHDQTLTTYDAGKKRPFTRVIPTARDDLCATVRRRKDPEFGRYTKGRLLLDRQRRAHPLGVNDPTRRGLPAPRLGIKPRADSLFCGKGVPLRAEPPEARARTHGRVARRSPPPPPRSRQGVGCVLICRKGPSFLSPEASMWSLCELGGGGRGPRLLPFAEIGGGALKPWAPQMRDATRVSPKPPKTTFRSEWTAGGMRAHPRYSRDGEGVRADAPPSSFSRLSRTEEGGWEAVWGSERTRGWQAPPPVSRSPRLERCVACSDTRKARSICVGQQRAEGDAVPGFAVDAGYRARREGRAGEGRGDSGRGERGQRAGREGKRGW